MARAARGLCAHGLARGAGQDGDGQRVTAVNVRSRATCAACRAQRSSALRCRPGDSETVGMAVKVLIVEDNPVARSFLCRVVRESFSDTHHHHRSRRPRNRAPPDQPDRRRAGPARRRPVQAGAGRPRTARRQRHGAAGRAGAVPGHQDRHHAVLRRRPPVPGAAVRRRRLPAEGRPLRGAGRGAAEDRARPAAAVAGDRAPPADPLPRQPARRRCARPTPASAGRPTSTHQPPGADREDRPTTSA